MNERIRTHFASLTPSQKIVARFILEQPTLIAIHSAKRIGEMTETSEATVIRCCNALGYDGYTSMQEDIQKKTILLQKNQGPFRKYQETNKNINTENFANHVIQTDYQSLKHAEEELDLQLFQKGAEMITNAEKILVVGFRWCHIPAQWLSSVLNTIKGNTHLYKGGMDQSDYLITEREKKWLVIVISFPRHPKEILDFIKAVKKLGVKVLAITEGELSPIGGDADLMIKVHAPQPVATQGMTTLFSILNVLTTGVMVLQPQSTQQRLKDFDEISGKFYAFIEDLNGGGIL
ncbi:MurR/RpiR family transcriptional regulator [Bacillus massilinigeriensis]|uniref:MurR/RpiR family transcriptional regulator n=1 Tax=Bacillus massilionigeriensis TaxID=1805475 RepID=UPI001F3522C4|nr:MurR/RpiR family transcriptional regulator [Bacillus massilionigeriensis]